MTYGRGVLVDRLSVTVPAELGAALRALAELRGETVSTIVSDAIAHQVRLSAMDLALAKANRKHGTLAPSLVAAAEAELSASALRKRRARRARR